MTVRMPMLVGQIITISCSSEDQQKQVAPPSRKPYALRMRDLPPKLQGFLKESVIFHTAPLAAKTLPEHSSQHLHEGQGTRSMRVLHFYCYALNETFLLLAGSLTFLRIGQFASCINLGNQ